MRWVGIIIGVALISFGCHRMRVSYPSHTLNPLQFGLKEARSDVDRYYVLQRTHEEAVKTGAEVSYAGIKQIDIEIPPKAKPLPLTHYTDFSGVVLKVKNNQKDMYLFSMSDKMVEVKAFGKEIDSRDFSSNPVLKSGRKLLVVTDKTPWVENRTGYDFGATRKDIMLVVDGKSENGPVQSYSTTASMPECNYREAGTGKIIIKDVSFNRMAGSAKKTSLFKIENQCDLELSGISITTPDGSGFNGDRAIYLINCWNVQMQDVSINGTYSLTNKFGYGICLDNVYDFRVNDMFARANWGVFGTNNVHKASLTNCDINRFDIHCYGKDISFENCNFVDLYNQFASVYGMISFTNCTFTNFTPVLVGSSYNAYTACDILFDRCTFNLDKKHSSIVDFSGFEKKENKRPELKEKCLPNVNIQDCQVNLTGDVKKWCVYNTKKMGDYEGVFSHVSKVTVRGLKNEQKNSMEVFTKQINSKNRVQVIKE